jgi:hypothetical protein
MSRIPNYPHVPLNCALASFPNDIQIMTDKIVLSENTVNALAKRLGFEARTVRKYIKNKRYPITALRELELLTGEDVLQKVWTGDSKYFVKRSIVLLPAFLTPKLAYFAGYLQGDGFLDKNEKRTGFADEYEEQLQQMNSLCYELFGIRGQVTKDMSALSKKYYYNLAMVVAFSTPIYIKYFQ